MSKGTSKGASEGPTKKQPELAAAVWMIGAIVGLFGLSLLLRFLGLL